METYQKINTLYKRYKDGPNKGKIIVGYYSLPEFEYLKDNQWNAFEKIDGTNTKLIYFPISHRIKVEGKTEHSANMCGYLDFVYKIGNNIIDKLEETFSDEKFKEGDFVIIYGESYGNKIQSGGRYSKFVKFIVFDIKIGKWYLEKKNSMEICSRLGLDFVPCFGQMTLSEAEKMVKEGFHSVVSEDNTLIAEGLVLTPKVELCSRNGERIIAKIKHKDYVKI